MARKIEYISMLAEDTAREIVRNQEAWMHYLNTTARLYKYPFQEQIAERITLDTDEEIARDLS